VWYALSPYIKQIRFVFKGLIDILINLFEILNLGTYEVGVVRCLCNFTKEGLVRSLSHASNKGQMEE
jgi:hypothetical protein